MSILIKFVFRLFIILFLYPLNTPICTSLRIVIQSQYICIDKRRIDPKGYSPAVSYSLDLRSSLSLSRINSTCLNTYENNYERNNEEIFPFLSSH